MSRIPLRKKLFKPFLARRIRFDEADTAFCADGSSFMKIKFSPWRSRSISAFSRLSAHSFASFTRGYNGSSRGFGSNLGENGVDIVVKLARQFIPDASHFFYNRIINPYGLAPLGGGGSVASRLRNRACNSSRPRIRHRPAVRMLYRPRLFLGVGNSANSKRNSRVSPPTSSASRSFTLRVPEELFQPSYSIFSH